MNISVNLLINKLLDAIDKDQNPNFRLSVYDSIHQLEFQIAREREKMVDEIVNEVLSRLSISADTTEAIQKIEQLSNSIQNLGKERK